MTPWVVRTLPPGWRIIAVCRLVCGGLYTISKWGGKKSNHSATAEPFKSTFVFHRPWPRPVRMHPPDFFGFWTSFPNTQGHLSVSGQKQWHWILRDERIRQEKTISRCSWGWFLVLSETGSRRSSRRYPNPAVSGILNQQNLRTGWRDLFFGALGLFLVKIFARDKSFLFRFFLKERSPGPAGVKSGRR